MLRLRLSSVMPRSSTTKVFNQLNSRAFHTSTPSQAPCRYYTDDEEREIALKHYQETIEQMRQFEKELCDARSMLVKAKIDPSVLKDPLFNQRLQHHLTEHRQHRQEDHDASVQAIKIKMTDIEKELKAISLQIKSKETKAGVLTRELANLRNALDGINDPAYLSSLAFLDRDSKQEKQISETVKEATRKGPGINNN